MVKEKKTTLKKIFESVSNMRKTKKEVVYFNLDPIDEYIDKYFLVNCPENASVSRVSEQVVILLHRIFISTNEK